MMLWPLLTGRLGIGAGALLAGAFAAWWLTSATLSARHEAEIQSIRAAAAEQYASATQRAAEVERAHAQLATQLEVQHEKATRQLAAVRADNRRLARDLGGLRDPYAAAPACPVPTDSDSAVDSAATATVGRLSAEASEFLLDFAYAADRAAEYASTCHQWAKELKREQIRE